MRYDFWHSRPLAHWKVGMHLDISLLYTSSKASSTPVVVKQGLSLLSSFLLCLVVGTMLVLSLKPILHQDHSLYRWVLLPLALGWWGIVLPLLAYRQLQQFQHVWHTVFSLQKTSTDRVPIVFHLSLDELEIRSRRSRDVQQRRYYSVLQQATRGTPLAVIAAKTGLSEQDVTAFVVSYNTWGPGILRTHTGKLAPFPQLPARGRLVRTGTLCAREKGTTGPLFSTQPGQLEVAHVPPTV